MTFMVRLPRAVKMRMDGARLTPDENGTIELPEGTLIPIDDAERFGVTTEDEERRRANRGQPLRHVFRAGDK